MLKIITTYTVTATVTAALAASVLLSVTATAQAQDAVITFTDFVQADGAMQGDYIGDFNSDGSVDTADYTIWRLTAGQTGERLRADANGDGRVDSADYEVWRVNFGGKKPHMAM